MPAYSNKILYVFLILISFIGFIACGDPNYILEASWKSTDINDSLNQKENLKSISENKKSAINNDIYENYKKYASKKIDYNKQFKLGAFDNIQIVFKDESYIKNEQGKINSKYEKYGTIKYYPDNPIPELAILEIEKNKSNDINNIIAYYNSLSEVKSAIPDYYMFPFAVPDDPSFSLQWEMQSTHLNMPDVWDITEGESYVKVVVMDSGIDLGGEDTPKYIDQDYSKNFTGDGYTPFSDGNGHGTHVAGTIAQNTNNNKGVSGMAPNVKIVSAKIFSSLGGGATSSQIKNAIQFYADLNNDGNDDNDVDVINMSFGALSYTDTYDPSYQTVITNAYNAGIALIAATGNSADGFDLNGDGYVDDVYNGTITYPAAYDNVLAVGATDYLNERSYYSQYGDGYAGIDPDPDGIDIVAPGGDTSVDSNEDGYGDGILQETITTEGFGYSFLQGTSMATPHVSGLAALLRSIKYDITVEQIYDTIMDSADQSMDGYNSNEYGAGIINPLETINNVLDGNLSYEIYDKVDKMWFEDDVEHIWEINVSRGSIDIDIYSNNSSDGYFHVKLYHPSDMSNPVEETTGMTRTEHIYYNTETGAGPGVYIITVSK